MDNITKQDRITLKNLKVADFASEETLCFNATVVFDGTPIAEARNDGHGGSTFLHALNGKAGLLAQAEAFAKGLPPAPLDLGHESEDPHYIDMTLDFLVDELADAMHAERKVRAAFNRDIGNKVLFIKEGKLLFIKGIKLKAIADRKAYFASLRARQAGSSAQRCQRIGTSRSFRRQQDRRGYSRRVLCHNIRGWPSRASRQEDSCSAVKF